ncbi:MAG: phage portal protein [candidate division Zixibacteria bacterium]|nr:phage portal protein [candidate division Zixibacteria bacterium]
MVELNFLRQKWQADKDRQAEAQDKLDLYMDDFEAIIMAKIAELFHKDTRDRLLYHVNQSQNILKRVVNEISTLYKTESIRTTEPESDRYQELLESLGVDVTMKKINRYTNLLNESLLKVGVRHGKIVHDIITPNICTVIQNEADPTQADAIIYMTTRVNTPGSSEIRYHYWSKDGDYLIYDESFQIVERIYDSYDESGLLRYPYIDPDTGQYLLPFVTFHRQDPDYAYWDQDSGRDLYNATVATAIKMSLFDYYFKTGSFKQIYLIGDDAKMAAKQVLDPLTVLRGTGEDAEIGVLDRELDMEQLKNAIIFQINSIINNYGISADQYSLIVSEMSGRALKIRNRGLLEIRKEQLPIFKVAEEELFKVTRAVNNAHFPNNQIPDTVKFNIDYGELEIPEDPDDDLELQTKRLRSGLISPGQYYQHFNPDEKDEEEAEKTIADNLAKLEKMRLKYPNLDEALDFILGPGAPEKRPAEGEGE